LLGDIRQVDDFFKYLGTFKDGRPEEGIEDRLVTLPHAFPRIRTDSAKQAWIPGIDEAILQWIHQIFCKISAKYPEREIQQGIQDAKAGRSR
jgi:hypothetical protein